MAGVSLAATALSLPFIRHGLNGRGVLDHVSERSSHLLPTPRGGGLGVAVGATIAILFAWFLGGLSIDAPTWALIGTVATLATVGFLDDLYSLPPLPRILVQVASGCVIAIAALPGQSLAVAVITMLGAAAAMVFIVNTVNFMDGINGMTAATMTGWGAVSWWAGVAHDVPIAVGAGAVALGTSLGFLPFNVPRASIFLGDVGSYLYGALIASVSVVMLAARVPTLVVLAPLVPYAADVVATLIRRALRGESLTEAHREHFYQALTDTSLLNHAAVAAAYGLLALAGGTLAIIAPAGLAVTWCASIGLLVATGPFFTRQSHASYEDPA